MSEQHLDAYGEDVTRDGSGGSDLPWLVAEIVSAYVSNNAVPASDLPALIDGVAGAMSRVGGTERTEIEAAATAPLVPAVDVDQSVHDEFIVCLEDGKRFKSLKRHLMTHYNLTPEDYRTKWGLPVDYPMVAPSYAARRSELAKSSGLGRKRAAAEPTPLAA